MTVDQAPKREPEVGQTLRYFDNAAIVVWVWSMDSVDLIYWDRFEQRWIEVAAAYRGQWREVDGSR